MNVIDHISVGVSNIKASRRFYDPVLGALDVHCLAESEGFAAYGIGSVQFLTMKPFDGQLHSGGNGSHVCFVAPSEEAVRAFYARALEGGGSCEGTPGPRADYPKESVFACFVRDPFGNKLEAIHNGFAV